MSCDTTECMPLSMNGFFNTSTFYTVNFKDNTSAYLLKDTLLNTIKFHMKSVQSIVKFIYDKDLYIHNEFVLFSEDMKIFGNEYMKTYQNLHEMYGFDPLDDFDRQIIMQLNDGKNSLLKF